MSHKRFLLIHAFHCHYEIIPSVIHYFGKLGDLDCMIYFGTGDEVVVNRSWLQVYNKLNTPYKLVNAPEGEYDCIIFDTEDHPQNWYYLLHHYHSLKNCQIFAVSCNKQITRHKLVGADKFFKINMVYIQSLNTPIDYHCASPFINSIRKDALISRSPKINICTVGDIVNRWKDFFSVITRHISNFNDVQFHFISRRFTNDFYQSARNIFGDIPDNVKLYHDIPATTMLHVISLCDYIYYYPEIQENIGQTSTGAINLSYSTLTKFICPVEYIDVAKMGPETGLYLKGLDDSVTVTKLTFNDIVRIEDESEEMAIRTLNLIDSLL